MTPERIAALEAAAARRTTSAGAVLESMLVGEGPVGAGCSARRGGLAGRRSPLQPQLSRHGERQQPACAATRRVHHGWRSVGARDRRSQRSAGGGLHGAHRQQAVPRDRARGRGPGVVTYVRMKRNRCEQAGISSRHAAPRDDDRELVEIVAALGRSRCARDPAAASGAEAHRRARRVRGDRTGEGRRRGHDALLRGDGLR